MKVRIGIDVGGTFTDVVVIDSQTHELVGQLKLPTTHSAREGVALGIVNALERAMAQLPEGCRTAFVLHDVEGLEHREIAEILGIAEGTSKSQVHKARMRLRALLGR